MPRIDPGTQNTNQVPKARAKAKPAAKPVKVRVTVPDAGDSTRTTQPHPVTPDQADRQRGPVQQATDAAVVTRNVRVSREKALGKQGRGSGTRAVKAWAKSNVADAKKFAGTDAQGHHAGSPFAMILANGPGPGGVSLKILKNAGKDAAELAVTTPSSIAKLGSDIVHHPGRVPGELAAPYVDLAKHPVKNATEKPVSTALEVQPFVKVPGRVLGRVARLKGAQTLERAPATLPGTALKETRTGSRDVAMRARQAKKDAAEPAPTVTAKQVQHRVDAHFDFAKHESHRIVGEHVKAARKATKGQPKPVRQAAVEAAREHGQQVANDIAQERFAREFGANERLSSGHVQRDLLHQARRQAVKVTDAARAAMAHANATHDAALANARAALAKTQTSPALQALERQRHAAVQALTAEQKAAAQARLAHERAHANARVSAATPKTNVRVKALTAEQRAAAKVKPVEVPKPARIPVVRVAVPEAVKGARAAVSTADRHLNTLRREMQRAQEKASRLEGISVGRIKGGKMTVGVGKQIADHRDYMGGLRDALTQAERDAGRARDRLKAAEGEHRSAQRSADQGVRAARQASDVAHRGAVRAAGREASQSARVAARAVEQRVAAERARISGVAPKEHQALLDAIDRVSEAPGRVAAARARVKTLDQHVANERARLKGVPPAEAQALTNAIHARGAARVALAQARADAQVAAHAHIAAKRAMTNATLVNPAKEGRLFAHKADAATVVKKLNQAATGSGAADPITFVLHQVGEDRWAAVPKVAKQRLYGSGGKLHMGHYNAGQGKATGARVMRVSRQMFTNSTLPVSLKWLGGQGAEAGVRAAVAGAGPMDWLRMGKVVKKLNAQKAGSGDELATRLTGGQFGLTGPARDFAQGKSLAEEFEGTPLSKPANAASAVGRTVPARAIKHAWRAYTGFVFGKVNHVIEANARRAMAGQAIKNLGFDERHINGLADKAIEDAANHLQGTHNQVALGRALNEMYGKYSGFSPEMRSTLAHWTPFLPWYLNTARFLFKTLPVDHPVKAALLADVSAAEEQWRKDHGLSLLQGGHVPDYLLGSYPKGDGLLRIAHYTPWGVGADPTGAAGDLLLPQIVGPVGNAKFGVDWKGDQLTRGGSHGPKFNTGEKLTRAVVTALEEQVPLVSQAGKISGVTPRFIDKDSPESIKGPTEVLKNYLPTTPSSSSAATPSSASSSSSGRVKLPGAGSSGRVKLPGGRTGRIKIP